MSIVCVDHPPALNDPYRTSCRCPAGVCDPVSYIRDYIPPAPNPPRPLGMKRGDARKRGETNGLR